MADTLEGKGVAQYHMGSSVVFWRYGFNFHNFPVADPRVSKEYQEE